MINPLQTVQGTSPAQSVGGHLKEETNKVNTQFSDVLTSALEKVSSLEHTSNVKKQMLAAGKIDDLHDVMITAQKASITVEAAVQVQQKVIDSYNEVMRMQI